jgi:hypothetical protein
MSRRWRQNKRPSDTASSHLEPMFRPLVGSGRGDEDEFHRTIHYIAETVETVREGRSAPRKLKNIKNDIHFPAYKSSL